MRGKVEKFGKGIGDNTGPLKYTITEASPANWTIQRSSTSEDGESSGELLQGGLESEDACKDVLYYLNKRNDVRVANTVEKLAGEQREGAAMALAIDGYVPPVPPDPI